MASAVQAPLEPPKCRILVLIRFHGIPQPRPIRQHMINRASYQAIIRLLEASAPDRPPSARNFLSSDQKGSWIGAASLFRRNAMPRGKRMPRTHIGIGEGRPPNQAIGE